MKKCLQLAAIIIGIITATTACSKKDNTTCFNSEQTLTKIIGFWKFDSSMNLRYRNNVFDPLGSDTTRGITSDYFDFRLDGKLYIKVSESATQDKDTGIYSYINNKLFLQGPKGDLLEFTINELNNKRFTFETKEDVDPANPGNYEKIIVTLKDKQ